MAGLEDPVWWRKRKWMAVKTTMTKGVIKCRAKKRVRVALSTAKPPHSHSTRDVPT